ncbi:TetR/AcrR family transcriptional regulator [Azospirillum doebereinerae]|uniref:TetR/AcrR family transcriptional regulator n=1 Tax=Azospirillum doebereinerae TaxID=92933 RepID=UPI001FD5E818|nr:TetR/AcrR family transcriptional regulator [Azospirillum doebereinerae]
MSAIIEAAARILEQEGHGGFSTNAVAKRAGVSVGSLYQYFPGKDALIGALLVRETSLLLQEAEAALIQQTGKDALLAMVAACIGHQFRRPRLARLLDFEEARLPLDPVTQMVGHQITSVARQILGRHDMPPQPDPAVAARDLIAIIKGMIDGAGMSGEEDCEALMARVKRATFGYIGIS